MIVLLSALTDCYSQKGFSFSFIASPQISWLKSDSRNVSSENSFAGFGYGVEGDLFLMSDRYAISTGMTVSSAGGSLVYHQPVPFSGKLLPAGTKVDYYLTNLEFPLVLKMRTRNFNRMRYFAQFGLTNWINIKARGTSNDPERSFQRESIRDEIRLIDIALNIGTGLEYDLGHGNALTGGLVYSNGFTDITANTAINGTTTLKVVRLRMGFCFLMVINYIFNRYVC